MEQRFRSESDHKVDAKGRVSIPAAFRRLLEEGDPDWKPGENPKFVIVYGRVGRNCLEGYTMSSVRTVDEQVSDIEQNTLDREIMERQHNAKSVNVHVDENGRIVLSAKLREKVGISNEATFCGMGEKFQIWEPSEYRKDNANIERYLKSVEEKSNPFAILDSGGKPE